jgi:hypothetical protein
MNSLKETVMGVALSLLCILDGWVDLILLYFESKSFNFGLNLINLILGEKKETVMEVALSLFLFPGDLVHLICRNFRETMTGVALSLWCILDGWADLTLLYPYFNIWCKEYDITYPSLKEKLYRFSVFKESFQRNASMPNGFGDRTAYELKYLLPLGSYDDEDMEEWWRCASLIEPRMN